MVFIFIFVVLSTTATVVSGEWNISIQLQGGLFWGYLQVLEDNQLKYICNDYWDIEDGRVSCRQLGLGDVFTVEGEEYSTSNTVSDVFLCNGHESNLNECQRTRGLSDIEDISCTAAYVSCGIKNPKDFDSEYIGCFEDHNDRILPHLKCDDSITRTCRHCLNDTGQYFCADYNGMTVDLCLQVCCSNGYKYAGLENGDQCFCGDGSADYSRYGMTDSDECSSPCTGNSGQECGGVFTARIYECILPVISTDSLQQTREGSMTTENKHSSTTGTFTVPIDTRSYVTSPESITPVTPSMSTNIRSYAPVTFQLSNITEVSKVPVTPSMSPNIRSYAPVTSQLFTGNITEVSKAPVTPSMSTNIRSDAPVTSQLFNITEVSKVPVTPSMSTNIKSDAPVTSQLSNVTEVSKAPVTPLMSTNIRSDAPFTPQISTITEVSQTPVAPSLSTNIRSDFPVSSQLSTHNVNSPSTVQSGATTVTTESKNEGTTYKSSATEQNHGSSSFTDSLGRLTTITKSSDETMGTSRSTFTYSTRNRTPTPFELKTGPSSITSTGADHNENSAPKEPVSSPKDDSQWYLYMILVTVCLIPILILVFRCFCWNMGHSEKHKFDYKKSKSSKKNGVPLEESDFDSLDDNCIITKGTIIDEEMQPVPIPSYQWLPVSNNQHLIDVPNDDKIDNNSEVKYLNEGANNFDINSDVGGPEDASELYSKVDFSKKKSRKTIGLDMNQL